jgi:hypothetical protein
MLITKKTKHVKHEEKNRQKCKTCDKINERQVLYGNNNNKKKLHLKINENILLTFERKKNIA